MNLEELKAELLLPERELILDQLVCINGKDVQLVALTQRGDTSTLWTIEQVDWQAWEEEDGEERELSHRQSLVQQVERSRPRASVQLLHWGQEQMGFHTGCQYRLTGSEYRGFMALQHFVERGWTGTGLEDTDVFDWVIGQHESGWTGWDKQGPDALTTASDAERHLIEQPFTFDLGEYQPGARFSFRDQATGQESFFYLDQVGTQDLWKEAETWMTGPEKQEAMDKHGLTEEQIAEGRQSYISSLEAGLCPRGMELVYIEYESEGDAQLEFFAQDYLAQTVKPSRGTVGTIMLRPDKSLGPNGGKRRVCALTPAPKGWSGPLKVELLYRYIEVPSEMIKLK